MRWLPWFWIYYDLSLKWLASYYSNRETIGNYWGGSQNWGVVDEVRIYNRALSAREVRQLYEYAPGPVGHWKMDEHSGGYAYDTSGNGNTGTLYNSPSWVTGKYGGALNFDSDIDSVDCGSTVGDLNDDFTFGMWLKFNSLNSTYQMIAGDKYIENAPDKGYMFHVYATTLYASMADGTTESEPSWGGLSTGEWYYVTMVLDRPSFKLYVNGILKDTHDVSSIGDITGNSYPLYFGRVGYAGSSYQFDGLIDDVRIYNYARTQKQILEDMNADRPAQKSPVGYWKFNEGYGTSAKDSSGYGNNGTITGATWTNAGKFNKALSFDGSSSYVNCGNNSSLNMGTGSFTHSAWIKAPEGNTNRNIIDKGLGTTAYGFRLGTDGKVSVDIRGGGAIGTASTIRVDDNSWHYVSVVLDQSSDLVKIYIDGVLNNTGDASAIGDTDNSNNFFIGADNANQYYFDGTIDEVKIYNYALTEDEIKAEYNRGKVTVMGALGGDAASGAASTASTAEYCVPGDTADCDPPVAEWKFEEHSGTSAYDTSGNANTGTITNATYTSPGKIGSALKFDGSSDYVDCGSRASLDLTGEKTIEAWIKTADSDQAIIGQQGGSGQWLFMIESDGRLQWHTWATGPDMHGSTIVNDDNWHHVTAVISTSNSNTQFYIDGKLDKQQSDTISTPAATGSLYIASCNEVAGSSWCLGTCPNDYFNGLIDHVQIFDYARTPAQIAWDYNKGKPIAHYKFDKGEGTTIYDSSGNGNNGTLELGSSGQTSAGSVGTDDYVDINSFIADSDFNNGSISLWFKTDNSSGMTLFNKRYDNSNRIGIGINSGTSSYDDESLAFIFIDSVKDNLIMWVRDGDGFYSDNSWHNVVVVVDGVDNTIYVDGVKKDVTISSGSETTNSFLSLTNIATTMSIGRRFYTDLPAYFSGQIDDVRIYNYALTPLQVKTVYNMGAARLGTGE